MPVRSPRQTALAALIAVTGLAGCTGGGTPVPDIASSPSIAPSPSAVASGGCPVAEQTGVIRSNTLVDMAIGSDGLSDRIVLQLGDPAPEPTGSIGRLRAVQPPFFEGGSGAPVTVEGTHFVELHLEGMLLADEAGNPTYLGETSLKPGMLALKQVAMTEAFEGVYNFVIGYDGNGCVSLLDDAAARTLTLTIGH